MKISFLFLIAALLAITLNITIQHNNIASNVHLDEDWDNVDESTNITEDDDGFDLNATDNDDFNDTEWVLNDTDSDNET